MLRIRVKGSGMIPRGLGLAPRLTPFPADKSLIGTILSAGFKVEFVHPTKGIFVELTKKNYMALYDKYAGATFTPPVKEDPTQKPDEDPEPENHDDVVDDEDSDTVDDVDDEDDESNDGEPENVDEPSPVMNPKTTDVADEDPITEEADKAAVAPKVASDEQVQPTSTPQGVMQPKVSPEVQGSAPVFSAQNTSVGAISAKTTTRPNGQQQKKKKK